MRESSDGLALREQKGYCTKKGRGFTTLFEWAGLQHTQPQYPSGRGFNTHNDTTKWAGLNT